MEKFFNKIPLWVINALSVISALLTIITTIFSLFSFYNNWQNNYKVIFVILCSFILLLTIRMLKYKKMVFERQQMTSFTYHKLTHISRDLYFDIMKYHKDKSESIRNLSDTYKTQISIILTHLCSMMEKYCGQKMSACIKLITHPEANIEDITLNTLCRSNTSESNRGTYESTNKKINLIDNTDFLYIIDPNNDSNLNYFYKGNLIDYDKELRKNGKRYKNSNDNWKNDYVGTIVVPIQIENKRLYDSASEDSFHIIGFLCIDSKSPSAFLKRQETSNVDMLKSFADIIYILLSQYQHYLKKLSELNND